MTPAQLFEPGLIGTMITGCLVLALFDGVRTFTVKFFGGIAELLVDILRQLTSSRFSEIRTTQSRAADRKQPVHPKRRRPRPRRRSSRSRRRRRRPR